ncbi:uncharacterized protein LOC125423486 [Ziziphus jujuba]|uniref:Uncharacterized protein LOC125423486 n=1 Tax=Ziziphus jujuba TaxID=326968 RepID=A0ABM3IR30_ZIZJJ|nr:uncharacterized protein LOC125423486 [Ziziphus jujuba]XP_048333808.1 uncharacterized protein LOC125423486 [Ziziphus jujuba]
MASLATHLSAFVFLFPTGLHRLLRSSSLYLENPSIYRSKTWYFSEPRWKNLDLYALIVALPIASFSEIFIFLNFTGNPTYRFGFFQQSAVVFLFWVLILLIIFRENFNLLHINEGFVFVLVGISFLAEYSVIGKGITGLSGTVYELLGALALICAGCCMYLSIRPWSFFAEFLLSSGLIFKGTWILQTGLSLYTDVFALKGCQKISMVLTKEDADVRCDLEEDGLRGAALMKLLFIGHAIGVLVLSFVSFGLVSSKRRSRNGEAGGPLLAQLDSQTVFMRPNAELELE